MTPPSHTNMKFLGQCSKCGMMIHDMDRRVEGLYICPRCGHHCIPQIKEITPKPEIRKRGPLTFMVENK